MAKTYPEQLAEWVKNRKSSRQDKNLAAFLAVKTDIVEALDAGYAAKTIWAHLKESKRIDFGYDSFLNLVKRHSGVSLKKNANESHKKISKVISATPDSSTEPPKNTAPELVQKKSSGFRYNPTPNLEDLI